jgi:hypothetical protein
LRSRERRPALCANDGTGKAVRCQIGEGQRRTERVAEQAGVADAAQEKRFRPTRA